MCEDPIEQELGVLMVGERLIRILLKKKKHLFLVCFVLLFPLQQALEHNSFLSAEKKIEQGDVEQAFKNVDQIIEGKWP